MNNLDKKDKMTNVSDYDSTKESYNLRDQMAQSSTSKSKFYCILISKIRTILIISSAAYRCKSLTCVKVFFIAADKSLN